MKLEGNKRGGNSLNDRDFYRELEGYDKESKVHSCMGHMVCSLIGEMV